MNIKLPEIPQSHIDFANEIKASAIKHGIEKFEVTYQPDFDNRMDLDFNGNLKIVYSGVDGRSRPADRLKLVLDTSVTTTLTETPSSFS